MKFNKYRSKPITVDGQTYDSKKEYKRFTELSLLEKAGKIQNLQRQVKYTLIPSQFGYVPDEKRPGQHKRICLERECSYIADFVYKENGQVIVEDVKGYRDPASAAYAKFVIKRKLMLSVYGIQVKEV